MPYGVTETLNNLTGDLACGVRALALRGLDSRSR